MIGDKKIEVIPYKNFKERLNLMKAYDNCYIEVEDEYIIVYF